MTKKEKSYIISKIENEGFDYCFKYYSTFDEIKDKEFHELREKYLSAHKELAEYVGSDIC